MNKFFYLLPLLLLAACVHFDDSEFGVKVGDQVIMDNVDYRHDFRRGVYSLKADNCYITDVARMTAGDCSVVWESGLKDVPFSLELSDVSLAELMQAVSSAVGCSVHRMGCLWVFENESKKEDNAAINNSKRTDFVEYTYYFKIIGFSDREIVENLSSFQVRKLANGLYLFRGSLMDAIALDDILSEMMINQPVQYFFSVWLVSEDILRDFTIKLNGKLNLNARKVFGDLSDQSQWSLILDALGDGNLDLTNTDNIRRISGVVREGGEFNFNMGDEVPIPKRSVSDSGTVTDTGYEYQRTGLTLKLTCEGKSRGVLSLDLENTDISGYVGGYPVKHGSRLSTVLIVSDADKCYVGSCMLKSKSRGLFGSKRNYSRFHVYLVCDLVGLGQSVHVRE